jgi:hypothetical protein
VPLPPQAHRIMPSSRRIRRAVILAGTAFAGRSPAIPPGVPYSETGPIFVHAETCERYGATKEFPAAFREGRVLRAYNSHRDMIAAEVANGEGPEAVIERFLQKPETALVHVRSASHGCFTMEIERL